MTVRLLRAGTVVLLLATFASAGSNTNQLVPAFEPCTPPASSCPAVLASRFTFDSVALKSSKSPYIKDNAVAIAVELKGVRDPSGALVTTDTGNQADDFRLLIPASQITFGGITYSPGQFPSGDIVVGIDLKNGKGKASYKTPAGGEGLGITAEAVGIPFVVDSDGARFAVSGSRDKPAR